MQIVIDIDENLYNAVKDPCIDSGYCANKCYDAVAKGTPLPKGHGRLIDVNEITAFRELECNGRNVESLDEFTVVIKADEAESESEGV